MGQQKPNLVESYLETAMSHIISASLSPPARADKTSVSVHRDLRHTILTTQAQCGKLAQKNCTRWRAYQRLVTRIETLCTMQRPRSVTRANNSC